MHIFFLRVQKCKSLENWKASSSSEKIKWPNIAAFLSISAWSGPSGTLRLGEVSLTMTENEERFMISAHCRRISHHCWQAQPLTVKWGGMISVTLCHSSCKSFSQQEKPRSRNGKGRSRCIQPWLEVPLIGGQISKMKSAILIEPALDVQARAAQELFQMIWKATPWLKHRL